MRPQRLDTRATTDAGRTARPARLAAALVGLVLVAASTGSAAPPAERRASLERFTRHYWSQVRPNLHFQYGCDTGWHAFTFHPDGYFVYDRTIAGAWWMDHLGNVQVRTNSGERLLLFFDGGTALSQLQRAADAPRSLFGEEYRIYRECDT